jgi:TfoX/Sxy family transcriptional regulator of competence genes
MAYDEDLANRIRELIAGEPGVVEKKMFGGLAFLIGGHMSVSVSGKGGLLLHVAPEETEALLAKPHADPFEMRGRTMDGWLRVDAQGVKTKQQLQRWVQRGVAYARSLPPKEK